MIPPKSVTPPLVPDAIAHALAVILAVDPMHPGTKRLALALAQSDVTDPPIDAALCRVPAETDLKDVPIPAPPP